MSKYVQSKVSRETSLSIILDVSLSSTSTDMALAENDSKILQRLLFVGLLLSNCDVLYGNEPKYR
uniref:Uncharacterized protein n=1 Tax=Romanomermis culicivorax TaxID=13658 RepID=A0A915IGX7_ROMCU